MMGKEKTTTTQTQQVQATPEEQEFNRLQLELARSAQPGQLQLQGQSLALGSDFLTGIQSGLAQSPIVNRLLQGIDPNVTSDIVQKSLADVRPGLQAGGLMDSGVRAELETRTAGDIRRASEESNLNALFNLLNLSQGQAAQIQQPLLAQNQMLGGQLAGLRSITGNSTTLGMNPFLKSFQTSFGSSLGGGLGKATTGAIQGGMTGGFGGFQSGFGG